MVKFPHEKFLRMSNYHAFLYEDLLCFSQQFPQKAKLSQWIYTKKNLFMTWTLVSTDAYSRSRWRVHCVSFLSALFTVFLLICVVHLVLGCFPLYRTNRLETTQTILLRKNGTRRNQSYRWIVACVTDKTEPQDLRMRHHWPVHRWHRPFANQVEGKFVGGQNKNPGAASQTLLTGGIDYICDDTQTTISQCGWIAFQRFKSCSND